ncbi:MAG: DUF4384 domain-containing protein [Desulfobacterales bacterium]|nr:DUF4384 domain-containing protein [Desulfobacterales bacterium]
MKRIGRIRTLRALLAMLGLLMNLAACAGHQPLRGADVETDEHSLAEWLDETLVPYLRQQLGQHPRFKGQPLLLVRMQNDNVQPHIDELTAHIRTKIVDALVAEPGLDLYWRPAARPHQHHQHLTDITCGENRKINYYIGIDCRLTNLEQKLEVRVRALNLAEHKWVSGFGRAWQGPPTAAQLAALKREHPDAYLRGLRPLPFAANQPDLLASYLARNLSCLFQQGDSDDLLVHVEAPSAESPAFFKTTLKLVAQYLARFREVEVTKDPDRANVTVTAAIHSIHGNMYQIWVAAMDQRHKKYLPGAETEAYVLVQPPEQPLTAGIHQDPSPDIAPLGQPAERPRPLISSFNLITSPAPKACATEAPWQAGFRRLNSGARLPTGSCLAVEIRLAFPAHLFLIGQDARGDLTRLFPSSCRDFESIRPILEPGRRFQFPPPFDAGQRVLSLEGTPGLERIYAIAVTAPELANRFGYQLDRLQGLCAPGRRFPEALSAHGRRQSYGRVDRWQQYLNHLARQYPEKLQWREFHFWHERSL